MALAEARPFVTFGYAGRFGHFLRAEASASALSYPIPPRTVLLGMIGAILGLEKDTPQIRLKDALIAVSGEQPRTHWHRAKFRKEVPTPLPERLKAGAKGSDKPEKATLIKQEWLIRPSYRVTVGLPEQYHADFVRRIKERAWHYCPSLGLSEMSADLTFVDEGEAVLLSGEHTIRCESVAPQADVTVAGQDFLSDGLELQIIRMPREVSPERVFTHADYLVERRGRAIPVKTSQAYRLSGAGEPRHVLFL